MMKKNAVQWRDMVKVNGILVNDIFTFDVEFDRGVAVHEYLGDTYEEILANFENCTIGSGEYVAVYDTDNFTQEIRNILNLTESDDVELATFSMLEDGEIDYQILEQLGGLVNGVLF